MKALVHFQGVQGRGGLAFSYWVCGEGDIEFRGSYNYDFAQTAAQNMVALRQQIIRQTAQHGGSLLATDIVIAGAIV